VAGAGRSPRRAQPFAWQQDSGYVSGSAGEFSVSLRRFGAPWACSDAPGVPRGGETHRRLPACACPGRSVPPGSGSGVAVVSLRPFCLLPPRKEQGGGSVLPGKPPSCQPSVRSRPAQCRRPSWWLAPNREPGTGPGWGISCPQRDTAVSLPVCRRNSPLGI